MVQTFIRLAVETSSTRVCASDGSSKEEVGAWAVAFEQQAPIAAGFACEDQSSFLAELHGLMIVLEAAAFACRTHRFASVSRRTQDLGDHIQW